MPHKDETSKKVVILAGEPSGDLIAASLMEALIQFSSSPLKFYGVGGEKMSALGLSSFFPMEELSVMGIVEVLPKIFKIKKRIEETVLEICHLKPDVVITVDAPGFNFRVQKKLRDKGIPQIHCVAPSVWAWRPGRAKKIAKFLDHLLVLFPFEPPYFEKEGLKTTFIGHPIAASKGGDKSRFLKKHTDLKSKKVITVLPGSRGGEISNMLPIYKKMMQQLQERYQDIAFLVPTLPHLKQRVEEGLQGIKSLQIIEGEEDKKDAFAASSLAVATSGTISLELAKENLPMVIAYKSNPFTIWLIRKLVKVRFICLVNLLLDRGVVPELIQENCTPWNLVEQVVTLLENEAVYTGQQKTLKEAISMLDLQESKPGKLAAETILNYL